MKKIIAAVLCFVITTLLLSSCSLGKPEDALAEKLDSLISGKESVSSLIASSENESDTGKSVSDEQAEKVYALICKSMTYKIGNVTEDKNTAVVNVDITTKDVEAALGKYLQDSLAHILDENWDADSSKMISYIEDDSVKEKTFNVSVNMTKTQEGWTIDGENNQDFLNAITGGMVNYSNYLDTLFG